MAAKSNVIQEFTGSIVSSVPLQFQDGTGLCALVSVNQTVMTAIVSQGFLPVFAAKVYDEVDDELVPKPVEFRFKVVPSSAKTKLGSVNAFNLRGAFNLFNRGEGSANAIPDCYGQGFPTRPSKYHHGHEDRICCHIWWDCCSRFGYAFYRQVPGRRWSSAQVWSPFEAGRNAVRGVYAGILLRNEFIYLRWAPSEISSSSASNWLLINLFIHLTL